MAGPQNVSAMNQLYKIVNELSMADPKHVLNGKRTLSSGPDPLKQQKDDPPMSSVTSSSKPIPQNDPSELSFPKTTEDARNDRMKGTNTPDFIYIQEASSSLPSLLEIKVPTSLANYRCHFNWMNKTLERPFAREEAIDMVNDLGNEFELRDEDQKAKALKYKGKKMIVDKMSQAFCNILMRQMLQAKDQIEEARKLIEICVQANNICGDYAEGFIYVLNGIELLYLFVLSDSETTGCKEAAAAQVKFKLKLIVAKTRSFESLSVKGQVAVMAAEHFFAYARHDLTDYHLELLEKVTSKDIHYEWYLDLFHLMRDRRRKQKDRGYPERREQETLTLAVGLAQDHPHVLTSVCVCILEMFKNERHIPYGGIQLGPYGPFTSGQQVKDFVRETAEKVLKLDDFSSEVNMSLADCFSILLPARNRNDSDYEIARQCIERRLASKPSSSKGNHRMAGIYLSMENGDYRPQAMKYLKLAVESKAKNFPAMCDLIKLYIGIPNEQNALELAKLFDDNLQNSRWSDGQRGQIYFLQGLYMFMKGDYVSAVDNWIEGYTVSEEAVQIFRSLRYHYRRHRWNEKDTSVDEIIKVLTEALGDASGRDDKEKEVTRKILYLVQQYNSGGGSSRNFHGRGGFGTTDSQNGPLQRRVNNQGAGDLANGDDDWRRNSSSSAHGQEHLPSMGDGDGIRRLPMRPRTISTSNPGTNSSLNNKEEGRDNIYRAPRRDANYGAMENDWRAPDARSADVSAFRDGLGLPRSNRYNRDNNNGGQQNRMDPNSISSAPCKKDEPRCPW